MRPALLALAATLWALPSHAAETPVTLVACAPGYPGSTAEAQPAMDAFAAALAKAAGWAGQQLAASYVPSEKEGLARLGQAQVGLVSLPFYVKHAAALRLSPRLVVQQKGLGPAETWTLVAKKGRVSKPADLAGFTLVSLAGYAPDFVRSVLGPAWRLSEATQVVESTQVLSALRRAVQGEAVAVLLDGAQGNALPTLPFAAELEVVARSAPLPAALVTTVGSRLPAGRWAALDKALLALPQTPGGATALDGIRMVGFAPADAATLQAVRALAGPGR
ncbi:MAG: PhnD/SsuA/transferrin family substrate-binding protein [Myxococcaceae bacterium]